MLASKLSSGLSYLTSLEEKHGQTLGLIYCLISYFIFAIYSLLIAQSRGFPAFQLSWYRGIFGILVTYTLIKKRGVSFFSNSKSVNFLLVLRGLNSIFVVSYLFYGFQRVPVSEGIVLEQTIPMFTGVLAYFFLSEKYGFVQFLFTILNFIGVILIIKPGFLFSSNEDSLCGFPELQIGRLSILGCTLHSSISITLGRKQAKNKIDSMVGLLYVLIFQTIFPSLLCIVQGVVVPTWNDYMLIIPLCIFSYIGNYLLNYSYKLADASKIALMGYSEILFGYALDLLYLEGEIEFYSLLGSIVIFSCLFVEVYQIHQQRKM